MTIEELRMKDFIDPVLDAIKEKGESATFREIKDSIAQLFKLTEDDLIASYEKSGGNIFTTMVSTALQVLKRKGKVEKIAYAVWALTKRQIETDKPPEIDESLEDESLEKESLEKEEWKTQLKKILLEMKPESFERLIQRLLRKAQFDPVKVTQKTRDGGIDGFGLWKAQDFLSFVVVFQCKRHQSPIAVRDVDQFIGCFHKSTEIGKPERGIFITTSRFTPDAKKSSVNSPIPLQLIDGDELLEYLKKYELGVEIKTEKKEIVNVNSHFFEDI